MAPKIDLSNPCEIASLGNLEFDFDVGSLSVSGLPGGPLNEVVFELLDEALDHALSRAIGGVIERGLNGAVRGVGCESNYDLYRLYMAQLGAGVDLHSLPASYIESLQRLYPDVDLRVVRFGFGSRQMPDNATTDCHTIYFNDREFVERLRDGQLETVSDWHWTLHELAHTEQCSERGGRRNYAEIWFRDVAYSTLVLGLFHPAGLALQTAIHGPGELLNLLHDTMPLEADAERRQARVTLVRGSVFQGGAALDGYQVAAFRSGASPLSAAPLATSSTRPEPLVFDDDVGYELGLTAGTYDLYLRFDGETRWLLNEEGFVVGQDTDGDGRVDIVEQNLSDLPRIRIPDSTIGSTTRSTVSRGDASDDGRVDFSDVVLTLKWAVAGGAPPPCPNAADFNADGAVGMDDVAETMHFLLGAGAFLPRRRRRPRAAAEARGPSAEGPRRRSPGRLPKRERVQEAFHGMRIVAQIRGEGLLRASFLP